ncbi:hypothetical protein CBR_g1059 [Chara braunii]|uniref:AB hydrolase-1 domain-containing protein n=1 Tax=Chara braunii TaxID=69332 RepID=A0A388KD04_CHABU|nr:hypothetical protein CBR_g1059 [Chara braunii]|eukprot:GBG67940.1 hypothetical protein CBR_g1059 [Chara braunii]
MVQRETALALCLAQERGAVQRSISAAAAAATECIGGHSRLSYYGRPWEWNKIKSNAGWIAQFGSPSDPYIPIDEMQTVAKELQSEYSELEDRGHFCDEEFPELLDLLLTKLQIQQ